MTLEDAASHEDWPLEDFKQFEPLFLPACISDQTARKLHVLGLREIPDFPHRRLRLVTDKPITREFLASVKKEISPDATLEHVDHVPIPHIGINHHSYLMGLYLFSPDSEPKDGGELPRKISVTE